MYITENQSLGESVLFLLSARNTLAEMVVDSGHEDAEVMVEFLINEASDYEIVSLLVEGVIPDEKYNEIHEAMLFSVLKEQVLANSEMVSEMVGYKTFSDFMTKVDSVYPQVSTAAPMLEFFSGQMPEIAGAMLLTEGPAADLAKALAKRKAAAGTKGGEGGPEMTGGMKSFPGGKVAPTGKGAAADASTKADLLARGPGGKEAFDVANPTVPGGFGKKAAVDATTKKLGSQSIPDTGPGPAGFDPKMIKATEPGILAKIKGGIESAADAVSAFAKTGPGLAVGGAALAALLGYGAAKTYRRFFSKAAGACRGMGGAAKTDCMNKFRGRALMAQAGDLQRGMASCGKSKNPSACKSAVSGKIDRLKARARKLAG